MTERWALVTGAARRIGRVTALDLAKAGWNIVVHYNHSQDEAKSLVEAIQDLGREACLAEIDLQNEKAVAQLIPQVTAELGPLGALVNNASLFEPDSFDPDGAHHHAINVVAPTILSEGFYASHKQHKLAQLPVIVNLLDSGVFRPQFSAYNRSKCALESITRDMALRFAPFMRVNGAALGRIVPSPRETESHFDKWVAATPLGVRIVPESVASGIRFLVENPAITGEVIRIDGGGHLKPLRDISENT